MSFNHSSLRPLLPPKLSSKLQGRVCAQFPACSAAFPAQTRPSGCSQLHFPAFSYTSLMPRFIFFPFFFLSFTCHINSSIFQSPLYPNCHPGGKPQVFVSLPCIPNCNSWNFQRNLWCRYSLETISCLVFYGWSVPCSIRRKRVPAGEQAGLRRVVGFPGF